METTDTQQQAPTTRKRRAPIGLIIVLLLLGIGAVAVVNLFNQSLITAEEKHDHDGDGKKDH